MVEVLTGAFMVVADVRGLLRPSLAGVNDGHILSEESAARAHHNVLSANTP